MKVYIGGYPPHVSMFEIEHRITCFLHNKDHKTDAVMEDEYTQLDKVVKAICSACQKVLDYTVNRLYTDQIAVVKIDYHDIWSMDHTLARIIVPMLKLLKEKKHGSPYVDPEDAPTIGKGEETDFGHSDDKVHERWAWVLDEMIYAFEAELDDKWDAQFESGVHDIVWEKLPGGNMRMGKGPKDTFKIDYEARQAALDRRDNGRRLFAKYYNGLWD